VLGRVYFSTWWCSLQLCLAVLALIVIGVNMHIDLDSAGSPPSGRPPLTVGLASRYILESACTLRGHGCRVRAVLCLDVVSACTLVTCVYVCGSFSSPLSLLKAYRVKELPFPPSNPSSLLEAPLAGLTSLSVRMPHTYSRMLQALTPASDLWRAYREFYNCKCFCSCCVYPRCGGVYVLMCCSFLHSDALLGTYPCVCSARGQSSHVRRGGPPHVLSGSLQGVCAIHTAVAPTADGHRG